MKPSEFFTILCDQIPTPIEGVTAQEFDDLPPKILRLLEAVEAIPADSLSYWVATRQAGGNQSNLFRAALALKEAK